MPTGSRALPMTARRIFFEENARVPLMRDALVHRDAETYLRLMNASGRSSEQLLRNIRAPGGDDRLERGLARAAALLDGVGAWRVHGGGFAGCVQALMPRDAFPAYQKGEWRRSSAQIPAASCTSPAQNKKISPLPVGSGLFDMLYLSRIFSSTGLWSENRNPSSCVCTPVSSTFGERMKPSIT